MVELERAVAASPWRNRPFVLLLAATFLSFASYSALLPIVPLWAAHGGASEFAVGATTGVFMAATVASQLTVPALLDRSSRRAALLAGTVVFSAPAVVLVWTDDIWPILIVAAVRGIGFGLLTVSGSVLVAELNPPSQLGRASGMYGIAVGLPALLVIPAATSLVSLIGFQVLFVGSVAVPLLSVGVLLLLPGGREPRERGGAVPSMAAVRAMAMPLVLMLSAASGAGAAVTFLPLAIGAGAAAAALFGLSATVLAGRWLSGRLGDSSGRPGRQLPVAVALVFLGCAAVALGFGLDAPVWAIIGAAVLGTGFGVVQNDSMVLIFARLGERGTGFAGAAWNIGYDAGTGVGSILVGAVVSGFGYASGFGVLAALALLLVPLTLLDLRRPHTL